MMTVATIVELIEWRRGRAPTVGIRWILVIGIVLLGLGMLLTGIAPIPGGL